MANPNLLCSINRDRAAGDLRHPLQASDDSESFLREAEQGRNDFEIVSRCSLSERYLENDLSVILELAPQGDGRSVEIVPRNGNRVFIVGIPVKVNIDSGRKPNGVPERR